MTGESAGWAVDCDELFIVIMVEADFMPNDKTFGGACG
jgi:hypothetical protein